jgi:hypothetical protein
MTRCALCGFEYEPVPSCPPSCPLKGACHFICCPRCGYQNIDTSQAASVKLVRTLWSKYVERKNDTPNAHS